MTTYIKNKVYFNLDGMSWIKRNIVLVASTVVIPLVKSFTLVYVTREDGLEGSLE